MVNMSLWDINDQNILRVLRSVPREKFIPQDYRNEADDDFALPIGFGQTISQPYIVAYMTEKLNLLPNHKVLEIGTGSGYQTAVLSSLVSSVYSIEKINELSQRAQIILKKLTYTNIFLKIGDGYEGWQDESPFDRIIVTAAPLLIPPKLLMQLAPNGKMIIPVGPKHGVQDLLLIKKLLSGEVLKENLLPVRFVPLI